MIGGIIASFLLGFCLGAIFATGKRGDDDD
jgi:hypothetical protein